MKIGWSFALIKTDLLSISVTHHIDSEMTEATTETVTIGEGLLMAILFRQMLVHWCVEADF